MEKLWLFKVSRWLVRLISVLYFRIEFVGADRAPKDGPMIVAPNHVSYLDPFWVSIPLDRPLRYMTWDKMTRLPLLGPQPEPAGRLDVIAFDAVAIVVIQP